jgi:hypothetical protein
MAYRVEIPGANTQKINPLAGSPYPAEPVTSVTTGNQPMDATEGPIIAVLIASEVLGCDIWFALDDSFTADDGLAVFYPDELPFLATKDTETLREIHKTKMKFPGSRIKQ